uniref:Uncharacterized protein n=1 Tax=Romanomermis culicivorax TaxID=13658 RepID=A0A915JWU1_ROMCU
MNETMLEETKHQEEGNVNKNEDNKHPAATYFVIGKSTCKSTMGARQAQTNFHGNRKKKKD